MNFVTVVKMFTTLMVSFILNHNAIFEHPSDDFTLKMTILC